MKAKKWLAVVVSMVMLFSLFAIPVSAEGEAISVRLSFSKYGEFLTDKNGDVLAMTPLTLPGSEPYRLDDVLSQAHALWYDGEEGYGSEDGAWGDISPSFGEIAAGILAIKSMAKWQ